MPTFELGQMTELSYRIFNAPTDSEAVLDLRCDVVDRATAMQSLALGEIEILGQLANSSNSALIGSIDVEEQSRISVIIKSAMYENPLADFEWGTLVKREVAAFELSQLLGWEIVPPTVLRDVRDMQCSVQLFIPHDPREHYFTIAPKRHGDMEKFVVFDYIANNADRKAGHIVAELEDSFELFLEPSIETEDESESNLSAKLWGIDHGLTFNSADKLRTVIWEYAEQEISSELVNDIHRIHKMTAEVLSDYLTDYEVEKTVERIEKLLINPYHRALDPTNRAFPWPLV